MGRDEARSDPDLPTCGLGAGRAVQPRRVARADVERWQYGTVVGRDEARGYQDLPSRKSGVGRAVQPRRVARSDVERRQDGAVVGYDAARGDPEITKRAQDIACAAFAAIDGEGLARVDMFITGDQIVINEINTMPGFTPISMFPRMWNESGMSYPELIDYLISDALRRGTGLR